jgi:hypothetical protein
MTFYRLLLVLSLMAAAIEAAPRGLSSTSSDDKKSSKKSGGKKMTSVGSYTSTEDAVVGQAMAVGSGDTERILENISSDATFTIFVTDNTDPSGGQLTTFYGPDGIFDFMAQIGVHFSKDPEGISPDLANAAQDREGVKNFMRIFNCPTCSVPHFTNTISLNDDYQIEAYNGYLVVDTV